MKIYVRYVHAYNARTLSRFSQRLSMMMTALDKVRHGEHVYHPERRRRPLDTLP
jgi:hypothetical protein